MLGEGDIVEYQVEYDPRKGFFPPFFSKTEGKKNASQQVWRRPSSKHENSI
jgi:hypothetical protein